MGPGRLCKQQVVPGQRLRFHNEPGVLLPAGGGLGDSIGVRGAAGKQEARFLSVLGADLMTLRLAR